MIMILVVLASLAPAYGCLGFLPLFQRLGFGGMNHPNEMYGLAVYFGTPLFALLVTFRSPDRGHGRVRVRCIPSVRSGILRRADPQRGRGQVVRSVLHYG